jgi:hypothetical protein
MLTAAIATANRNRLLPSAGFALHGECLCGIRLLLDRRAIPLFPIGEFQSGGILMPTVEIATATMRCAEGRCAAT